MSNFEGNVRKNANSFKPQTRASDGGVGKTVAGLWPGQEPVTVFEKADSPILDTDKAPDSGNRGERELMDYPYNLRVDHPNNDGQAKYLAGKIASVYRRIVADGADLETLSAEQRRAKRDQLIAGVYDGDGQHPSGEAGSTSQTNTLAHIRAIANVLFGLADADGVSGFVHKSVDGVSTFVKLEGVDAPEPSLEDLKKQLNEQVNILTSRLREMIARGAGVSTSGSGSSGSRFVTKDAGSGDNTRNLLKHALDHGTPVPFSGADPRSEAERATGSGRKFQTRR